MSKLGQINLEYIVKNEYYKVVPLLNVSNFVSYCKERGLNISKTDLERYEKLGLFYPLARIKIPKIKIKVDYSEDRTRYKSLGTLKIGEEWKGEIREQRAMFSFPDDAKSWFEEGLLWDPSTENFEEWDAFIDENGDAKIESYYSIFQCYPLYQLIERTKIIIDYTNWIYYDSASIDKVVENATKRSIHTISNYKKNINEHMILPLLCQVLSNRYYPLTQTDMRNISIKIHGFNFEKWDWSEFRRTWNPQNILNDIEKNPYYLKSIYDSIVIVASSIDPIEKWYELVRFVSLTEKNRLKDDALFAQTLYSIAEMLSLFYYDLTGERLPDASERGNEWKERFYGEGVTENKLQYLEFIANMFHLNPKPHLILIVEGEGEEKHIPRLVEELWGIDFSTAGIEILNLKGIGGFVGRKNERYGALEKLIDSYHNRQTIVFLILDDENKAASVKKNLIRAKSKLNPNRMVTKEEYIFLWNKNIEFDNFTPAEISLSMTSLAQGKYIFTEDEVREMMGKAGNPLLLLSKEKLDYGISKIDLLGKLFELIVNEKTDEDSHRPIVPLLEKIIGLAHENACCQPFSVDHWKRNQASGYLGDEISK